VEVPAATIQRQCSSAMAALAFGVQAIKAGDARFVLAGGVESMSSAPYVLKTARWGQRLTHGEMTDAMWEMLHSGATCWKRKAISWARPPKIWPKSITSPARIRISWRCRSHHNAEAAIKAGSFPGRDRPRTHPPEKRRSQNRGYDEHVRYGLTMLDLERLAPAFKKDGTVTAGNSSGLNDGAAAVIVTSRAKAQEMKLAPLARIVAQAAAGSIQSTWATGRCRPPRNV